MQSSDKKSYIKRNFRFLAVGWTVLLVVAFSITVYLVYLNSIEHARIHAFGAFEKDVLFRRWNALHGGVYVPITEYTQPNKYLKLKDRDVTTTNGKKLTLINPAYMTRQMYELARQEGGLLGNITFLNPIRPENKADQWETFAFEEFEKGKQEVASVEEIGGQKHLRLMRPLYVEAVCLNCHQEQNNQIGEIRGGISVAVPLDRHQKQIVLHVSGFFGIYGIVWILGLVTLKKVKTDFIQNEQLKNKAELELEELNRKLEEKVEDRTAELKKTQKELANKEKFSMIGKLAATIRHDLRNPLAVINNSNYYLRMKIGDSDETLKRHFNMIDQQIGYADRIIGDLLDFSKTTSPKMQAASVNQLLEEIINSFQAKKGLTINLEPMADLPLVSLDEGLIRRAIENILTNAEQSMPTGGEIRVSSRIEQDQLCISISDTGEGIPKENLERIFEPLFTTKKNGIGLGLMIVKEILAKHKGVVLVESEVKKGSTFIMKLPLSVH